MSNQKPEYRNQKTKKSKKIFLATRASTEFIPRATEGLSILRSILSKAKGYLPALRSFSVGGLLATLMWLILSVGIDVALAASDWYVRPASGNYGAEDGTSYENAWNGLLNVVWGAGGVEPGDTFYVCGLHVHEMTKRSYVATQASIPFISGTGENTRITIRGDYPGDPGIIWGTYLMSHEPWVDEGGNVWSIRLAGNQYPYWFFQDITKDSWIILKKVGSIQEVQSTPGSQYSSDYAGSTGSRLYVRLTDSGHPAGRVYANNYGYHFHFTDKHYVTVKNIKFYNFNRICSPDHNHQMSYITFDGCTLMYGMHSIIWLWDNMHYIKILNCEIAWAQNGIYFISTSNNAPSNYLIKGNYIHDIGIVHRYQDAHGIGIQGGTNGIIEDNVIERAGTGVTFYAFTDQVMKDLIIRRNIARDMHRLPTPSGRRPNGRGFETGGNNDRLQDQTGIVFSHNIVINAEVGFRSTNEDPTMFYNNLAYNCNMSYSFLRGYDIYGPKVILKNNMSLYPKTHHIEYRTGCPEALLQSDYNLFYPLGNKTFRLWSTTAYNFDEWRSHERPNFIMDPHSITDNPMLIALKNGDFHLSDGSPCIDAAVDVGLTEDFSGNPIPQGSAPDIGPYEFMGRRGDINNDGEINIQDVQLCINVILRNETNPDIVKRADINNDGDVNESDVEEIANIILKY